MAVVTSGWHKTWTRLRQMSSNELRARGTQELMKRVDLAKYRVGLRPSPNRDRSAATTGAFFFSVDDLPGRIKLLRERLPAECGEIVREADEIRRHQFRLLGYTGLQFGKDIDWHLDPVHGKRAPLEPWFKIRFLDFEQVGDHKVTWELNRHQHLVTLAKAALLTGDQRYVTEIIEQWYSWQIANPYPLGINWGSSLEVAFRSLSWLWVLHLLEGSPAIPSSFSDDVLKALDLHGRYIERYLSTYFSPNTHLLGEVMALLFIGTLCPQLKGAPRWKQKGWQILVDEAERQVRSDGVYFEQALYYHVYALDFFLHSRLLATRNGLDVPASFDETIRKMLEVVRSVSQAAPPESFGDDDGGRLFNPRRNRKEHLTDPLAVGAVTFHDEELAASAKLTEEAIWLFGSEALPLTQIPASTNSTSKSFNAGGIYVMASNAGRNQRAVIDAGPQGTGRSGHGHADALGLTLAVDGRSWLVDPGAYIYISEKDERNDFRGTSAHNTMCIDSEDQAVPETPFSWTSLPNVSVDDSVQGVTFDFFAGHHTGYERLSNPVRHRRFVFHLHGGFWFVRDLAEGAEMHVLETSWHFAPDVSVRERDGYVLAQGPGVTGNNDFLAISGVSDSRWSSSLSSGFVSPAYGAKSSAPVLRFRSQIQLPAEHAIVIAPLRHESDSIGALARLAGYNQASGVSAYRWEYDRGTHYFVFADAKGAWTIGPCGSDAPFFYARIEHRRVTHFAFCGGTFASLNGETVVTHTHALERFEWVGGAGSRQIYTSDENCQVLHSVLESTALY